MSIQKWTPEHFFNRELSWLEFNQRVMCESLNARHPVFERMKFLSIATSNLDEFFMIRVASLADQQHAGYDKADPSGRTPARQLEEISARVGALYDDMYRIYRQNTRPELKQAGIQLISDGQLTDAQREYLDDYFDKNIYPVLTPMAVDSSRPFPLIMSRSLNLGVLLEPEKSELTVSEDEIEMDTYISGEPENVDIYDDSEPVFATVQVPAGLGRVVYLPCKTGRRAMLLEQVIARSIDKLFAGRHVICCYPYRITRNADMEIDEEGAEDLLREIEKSLKKRKWGAVIRLETDYRTDKRLLAALMEAFEVDPERVYKIHGPLNLDFLMKELYKLPYPELKYKSFTPAKLELEDDETIFERIAKGDVLFFHPYDSFEPVVKFVEAAAKDPNVLAIKQTLYRVSGDSPIVAALMNAAENGKQVTALLEVKARFDEENNIHWGRTLEKAGAHVIYGLLGLKTHSKITLVVRREPEGIRRYVHLATGNYNDVTARIYTDHGMFTCRESIGEDASAFFNMLTGYSEMADLRQLVAAPHMLRPRMLQLIARETRNAQRGSRASILMKMNSLLDPEIIQALYDASRAGVKVRLIVRGICCLIPGLKGISENITVRSIVGRFLEHSRVYVFENNGREEMYLSSADMMPRNLDRRVELMFPVLTPDLKERIRRQMEAQWQDNVQGKQLLPDGKYEPVHEGETPFSAQEWGMECAAGSVGVPSLEE